MYKSGIFTTFAFFRQILSYVSGTIAGIPDGIVGASLLATIGIKLCKQLLNSMKKDVARGKSLFNKDKEIQETTQIPQFLKDSNIKTESSEISNIKS